MDFDSTNKMFVLECLKKRRYLFACISLLATSVGMAAYVIYRECYKLEVEDDILQRFGFLFQKVDNQSHGFFPTEKPQPVPMTEVTSNETCRVSVTCTANNTSKNGAAIAGLRNDTDNNRAAQYFQGFPLPAPSRSEAPKVFHDLEPSLGRLRDDSSASDENIQYIYHGCCKSHQKFAPPERLRNLRGQWRKVIQFKTMKQYFVHEYCNHVQGCNRDCQCMQKASRGVALVVDEGDDNLQNGRLELVRLPGSCKCYNNA